MAYVEELVDPKAAGWEHTEQKFKYRFVFDSTPILSMQSNKNLAMTANDNAIGIMAFILSKAMRAFCVEQNIAYRYTKPDNHTHYLYTSHMSWIVEMRMMMNPEPGHYPYLMKKLIRIEERNDRASEC